MLAQLQSEPSQRKPLLQSGGSEVAEKELRISSLQAKVQQLQEERADAREQVRRDSVADEVKKNGATVRTWCYVVIRVKPGQGL